MEKKEPIKISLPIFITILILLIAIAFGLYMYNQNEKLEKEIANLREEITHSQTAKNELQEKLNNISNTSTKEKEKDTEESNNSKETEKKASSNATLKYGEYYNLISSIKEVIEKGGNDNVSGQAIFSKDGKVNIAFDVVREFEGTYTVSGDTIKCKLTSILNEGEKEKNCNYTVEYKLLHNNGIEVLSSDIKYEDKNIYSNGNMLVCYR